MLKEIPVVYFFLKTRNRNAGYASGLLSGTFDLAFTMSNIVDSKVVQTKAAHKGS